MRRFLVSYQYTVGAGFGFGSLFHERADDALPAPVDIVRMRQDAAGSAGTSKEEVIVIAISEVSPDGPVIT